METCLFHCQFRLFCERFPKYFRESIFPVAWRDAILSPWCQLCRVKSNNGRILPAATRAFFNSPDVSEEFLDQGSPAFSSDRVFRPRKQPLGFALRLSLTNAPFDKCISSVHQVVVIFVFTAGLLIVLSRFLSRFPSSLFQCHRVYDSDLIN